MMMLNRVNITRMMMMINQTQIQASNMRVMVRAARAMKAA